MKTFRFLCLLLLALPGNWSCSDDQPDMPPPPSDPYLSYYPEVTVEEIGDDYVVILISDKRAQSYAYDISPDREPVRQPTLSPVRRGSEYFFRKAESLGQTGVLTDGKAQVVIDRLNTNGIYYIEVSAHYSNRNIYSPLVWASIRMPGWKDPA